MVFTCFHEWQIFLFRMNYKLLQSTCLEIFGSYKGKTSIPCALCPQRIKRAENTRRRKCAIASIIDHACTHLEKPLYFCRHCNIQLVTKGSLGNHLRRLHGLNSSKNNYIDNSSIYYQQIADSIKRCFVQQFPNSREIQKRRLGRIAQSVK